MQASDIVASLALQVESCERAAEQWRNRYTAHIADVGAMSDTAREAQTMMLRSGQLLTMASDRLHDARWPTTPENTAHVRKWRAEADRR